MNSYLKTFICIEGIKKVKTFFLSNSLYLCRFRYYGA